MAWSVGFDFRRTALFVTDPAGHTHVVAGGVESAPMYPTTRSISGVDITFGWEVIPSGDRDRDDTIDPRIAGIAFDGNAASEGLFRVDLIAAGDFDIRLAIGDAGFSHDHQFVQIRDNTTPVLTIDNATGTNGGQFLDASGVKRTSAAWPADNVAVRRTFASAVLRLGLGANGGGAGDTTLAHLFISQVAAGGTTVPLGTGTVGVVGQALGVNARTQLALGTGLLAVVGQALTAGVRLALGSGAVAVAGQALAVNAATRLLLGTGPLAVAGQGLTVNARTLLTLGTGTLTVVGQALSAGVAAVVTLGTGALTVAGQALRVHEVLRLGTGTLTVVGQRLIVNPAQAVRRALVRLRLGVRGLAARPPRRLLHPRD